MKGKLKLELTNFKWVKGKVLQLQVSIVVVGQEGDGTPIRHGILLKNCIVYRNWQTGELQFRPPSNGKFQNAMVTPDTANAVLAAIGNSKYASSIGSTVPVFQPEVNEVIPPGEKIEIGEHGEDSLTPESPTA